MMRLTEKAKIRSLGIGAFLPAVNRRPTRAEPLAGTDIVVIKCRRERLSRLLEVLGNKHFSLDPFV